MAIEIFIGRNEQYMRQQFGNNVYIVPEECITVSSPHAKLTIHNNGAWQLEDLNSKNGTYVRNAEGEYERVFNLWITPETIIRFGVAGHMSHTCWASHIKSWYEGNRDNYFYEFDRIQQLAAKYNEAVSRQEAINERHNWIATFSSAGGMVIFLIISAFKNSDSVSSGDMIMRMMIMSALPPLVKACFSKDAKKLKRLRLMRTWALTCPRCFMPLTDSEIENRKCAKCKAK